MDAQARVRPVALARFTIPLPMGEQFSSPDRHLVALSPDGGHIVYVANQRLYLRALDQLEALALRGTEGTGIRGGRSPFFSPDGQWVGFWQDGQLKKVSITGGAPVPLCVAQNPFGASWAADNTILYGQGPDGIWRVSGNGGKPENVVKVEAEQVAHGPQLLPGGAPILFTLARNKRLGCGADRRPLARHRHASRDPGRRHRRAVCADRSSRVRAWEHPPGGAV